MILIMLASGAAYFHFVYGPSKKFHLKKGKDDLLKPCDPSTKALEDILVTPGMSGKDAAHIGLKHGAVVIPSMLTKETANELRDVILAMNSISTDVVDIDSPENRYRVQPSYKIPIVKKAFKEIATHATFKSMMEEIMGPKPSLSSLDAITATFGALDQDWHSDSYRSYAIYPEEFLAEYSMAIVLQDTTDEMGATGVCPGTQKCSWVRQDKEGIDKVCPLTMALSQGDGFLYNADTIHKGRAHTDPDAGDRVLFFVAFSESRQGPEDKRVYALGDIHGLFWDMWGQTLDDLATIDERPWRPWHPFGLFNGHKDVRPTTLIDAFAQAYVDEDEGVYVFHPAIEGFGQDRIGEWTISLTYNVCMIALALYGVLVPCGLIFSYLFRPSSDPGARRGATSRANGTKWKTP
jgi:hypothetical protein